MKMIWVTFSVIGFHAYNNAPKDVEYLRNRHRHEFKFKVGIEVANDERDIEFHHFKRWLKESMLLWFDEDAGEFEFGGRSCEMIASTIVAGLEASQISKFSDSIRNRHIFVDVSEDGEVGAIVSCN